MYNEQGGDDETDLIRAAKEQPDAFAAIYVRYVSRVYRYMRTQSGTDEDASDLTQLVFLKALTALPRYRERGLPFASWLFRISRNVSNDFHRRRKGYGSVIALDVIPQTLHPADPIDYQQEVLDLQVQQQEIEQVKALLARLDNEQRELIALHFFAGLTLSEIAKVVKKSQGTVQRQMVHILHVLKEQYKEQFGG